MSGILELEGVLRLDDFLQMMLGAEKLLVEGSLIGGLSSRLFARVHIMKDGVVTQVFLEVGVAVTQLDEALGDPPLNLG